MKLYTAMFKKTPPNGIRVPLKIGELYEFTVDVDDPETDYYRIYPDKNDLDRFIQFSALYFGQCFEIVSFGKEIEVVS